ncbi:hypothetical protein [Clostridium botulinum]|uniref:hypothetical protein n=1 Tax=Clostridium botulinum TaxID=1491 RepID=UPI001968889C|nr:hypothetical protein [Clostridium botulinum]MBN1057864.1 hypothetical protein [Clostridium botulinum]MBN1061109.1 hypothetical protein [Clostridium botulinum]
MLLYDLEEERQKKKKDYTKETFYTPVTNKFMRESKLNLQEKAFYIYLRGFGDKCFQNPAIICEELGVTRPTLRKLMIALEKKNYIYVQRKFGKKTKEKATPVIHVIPLGKNDESKPSQYVDSLLDYLKSTYPNDY